MPLQQTFGDSYLLGVTAIALAKKVDYDVELTSNGIAVKTKTTSYSMNATTDGYILADAASANITITLPTTASSWNGTAGVSKMFSISKKDSSANTVTINTSDGATIMGETSQVLNNQYEVINLVTDGFNWYLLN